MKLGSSSIYEITIILLGGCISLLGEVVEFRQISEPPNILNVLEDPQSADTVSTIPAAKEIGNYMFTHWTLNGVRQEDLTGRSINPVTFIILEDTTAIAHYLSEAPGEYDGDSDSVPDWYEIEFYGTLNFSGISDTDGDGFTLIEEFRREYHPRLFNEIVEGGVARRRSPRIQVILDPNLVRLEEKSSPPGIHENRRITRSGTPLLLPDLFGHTFGGYRFTGWIVDGQRFDNPMGFSKGELPIELNQHTTAIARYTNSETDQDNDELPDWYEWFYFDSLELDGTSNPDGDEFDTATELRRNYQPNTHNEIVEGGISRRRSPSIQINLNPGFVTLTIQSDPPGLHSDSREVAIGSIEYLPDLFEEVLGQYRFTGWLVGGVRFDDSMGLAKGELPILMDRDITSIARYNDKDEDSDQDGVPDWHELFYNNSLEQDGTSDADEDGFTLKEEFQRGYHPNIRNEIVEGGVARRRSPLFRVRPKPPNIVTQPENKTVFLGEEVIFSVLADGVGPFFYQWQLNGVNIEGANEPDYTIENARPSDSGDYTVLVYNRFGTRVSEPATLTITVDALNFNDLFEEAPVIVDEEFTFSGVNSDATFETGEPFHSGLEGGASVWMSWTAPGDGSMTLDTKGSNFDTLLAVYRGDALAKLVEEASDDDSGAFLNSRVEFDAQEGVTYRIAIDGLAGARGIIYLNGTFSGEDRDIPRIIVRPKGVTVTEGEPAIFQVEADAESGVAYQWFLNGESIPGANNSYLVVDEVDRNDVGAYQVRLTSGMGGAVLTEPAGLDMGGNANVQAKRKLRIKHRGRIGGDDLSPFRFRPFNIPSSGFVSVSVGSGLGKATFSNSLSTKEPNEPQCVLLSDSMWYELIVTEPGILVVDTIGSDIDTALTVFLQNPNVTGTRGLTLMACDVNSQGSRVSFSAKAGAYRVQLDGVKKTDQEVEHQEGVIDLNWQLFSPSLRSSSSRLNYSPLSGRLAVDPGFEARSIAQAELNAEKLIISLFGGAGVSEHLALVSDLLNTHGLGVQGNQISFNGIVFATVSSIEGGLSRFSRLELDLSGQAGLESVQALIRSVGYANEETEPTGERTFEVKLTGGGDAHVRQATRNIHFAPSAQISGKVRYFDGIKQIPNLEARLDGQEQHRIQIPEDGTYAMEAGLSGQYELEISKQLDDNPRNGVTTFDLVLIRSHVLDIRPFESPHQIIAADTSQNNLVTTFDILLMRKLILNYSDEYLPGKPIWTFLPADIEFDDPLRPWGFETKRHYDALNENHADQDFIGIKLGDVNNSWQPSASPGGSAGSIRLSSVNSASEEEDLGDVWIQVGDSTVPRHSFRRVPVIARRFADVTSLQFSLAWDPRILNLKVVEFLGSLGLTNSHFGVSQAIEGKLAFAWDDPEAMGVTIKSGDVLFELGFQARGLTGDTGVVEFVDDPVEREASVEKQLTRLIGANGTVVIVPDPIAIPVRNDIKLEGVTFKGTQGTIQFKFHAELNEVYILEETVSLSEPRWREAYRITGAGFHLLLNAPISSGQSFFRIRKN